MKSKYTDLYQYQLTASGGMLFQFICSTEFVRQPNTFAMYWLKSFIMSFTYFLVDMNYLLNFFEPKILFS